ncbi:hypothetical protein BHM03_00055817 [Ensete ventricosum]|nr:hypothetical protein BHM03_00055817 [Ensete ventricosum]
MKLIVPKGVVPEPPHAVRSAPAPFRFPSPHARSDQLQHHSNSRAPALGSRAPAQSDQFLSSCLVGLAPAPISSRAPARSSPELPLVRPVPEPPLGTSPTSPQAGDSAQDLIFNTLIRHLEKVFQGGKNDMTNVDMTATSSHPRTTGPLTWSTRRGKSIWRSSSPQRSTIALTSLLLQLAVRFSLSANAAVLSLLLSMAFNSSVLANAVVTCLRHSRAASLVFDRAGERVTMK